MMSVCLTNHKDTGCWPSRISGKCFKTSPSRKYLSDHVANPLTQNMICPLATLEPIEYRLHPAKYFNIKVVCLQDISVGVACSLWWSDFRPALGLAYYPAWGSQHTEWAPSISGMIIVLWELWGVYHHGTAKYVHIGGANDLEQTIRLYWRVCAVEKQELAHPWMCTRTGRNHRTYMPTSKQESSLSQHAPRMLSHPFARHSLPLGQDLQGLKLIIEERIVNIMYWKEFSLHQQVGKADTNARKCYNSIPEFSLLSPSLTAIKLHYFIPLTHDCTPNDVQLSGFSLPVGTVIMCIWKSVHALVPWIVFVTYAAEQHPGRRTPCGKCWDYSSLPAHSISAPQPSCR